MNCWSTSLPIAPRKRWTAAEEAAHFKAIHEHECKLYCLIFSNMRFATVLLRELRSTLVTEEELTESIEKQLLDIEAFCLRFQEKGSMTKTDSAAMKKAILKMSEEFRLIAGPRLWVQFIYHNLVAKTGMVKNETFTGLEAFATTDTFLSWAREVRSLQTTVQKMKNDFVNDNVGLVNEVIKKRVRFFDDLMPYEDLHQEGCMGIMKAIDKFDYKKGWKFSTYATWWIRHAVQRAVMDKFPTIRIPVHLQEKINTIRIAEADFVSEFGRRPTTKELSKLTSFPESKIDELMLTNTFYSLDAPVGDHFDFHTEYHTVTPDTTSQDAVTSAFNSEMREYLMIELNRLDEREQRIIRGRFGLSEDMSSDEQYSLAEVGKWFNVSRERIRQLESIALQTMRDRLKRYDGMSATL